MHTSPMRKPVRSAALSLAATLSVFPIPHPVFAQSTKPTTVDLNYPGLHLRFTLPEGFCAARGQYAELAKRTFESQPDQLMLLAAFRCETMDLKQSPQESFTIKTAKTTLNMDAGDRSSLVNSGSPTDGGRDAFGKYTAVQGNLQSGNTIVHQVQSGAVTSVRHRLIVLNYAHASLVETEGKAQALQFIKEQTRKVVEENER